MILLIIIDIHVQVLTSVSTIVVGRRESPYSDQRQTLRSTVPVKVNVTKRHYV